MTPRDRPLRLAGYASRTTPVSEILDGIEVSAILLEDAARHCVIFSFDLMIVGSELQDMIHSRLERLGFAPDEVVLLASHTHYAPATDQACARLGTPDIEFVSELAEAAEGLVRQMQRARPVEIRLDLFQGRLDHSINRRRYWPFPTFGRTYGFRLTSVSLAPNPAGPRDENATVALLRNADNGEVVAALWHYACHATAVVPENVVSADYPGAVRRALRDRFGPNSVHIRARVLRQYPAQHNRLPAKSRPGSAASQTCPHDRIGSNVCVALDGGLDSLAR